MGILPPYNLEVVDIGNIDEGDFYVKFRHRYRSFENWWFLHW